MKTRLYLFTFLVITATTVNALAQNWTGAVDANWNNPANWSATPTAGATLEINPANYSGAAVSPIISAPSTFSPGEILISNGGDLVIQSTLTTTDNVEVIGAGSSLLMTNGNFSVNPTGNGRLIIDLGATMVINGGTLVVGQRFISGTESLVTINGGNITTNQRLLMDLGGAFVQNGGTVNVGETMALADGEGLVSCSYTLNDGVLNVTGELAFENEAGNFSPTFQMTGGTLNVTGEIFWFGQSPGSGTPKMLVSGGTVNVNGMISNMVGSTVNLYLRLSNDAVLNQTGGSITTISAADSIIQKDNSIIQFPTTTTITNGGKFHAYGGTVKVNGTLNLQGNGAYQFHHVEIGTVKTLNQLVDTLRVSGHFSNNGTYNTGNNVLVVNGSSIQNWSGTSSATLSNLCVKSPQNQTTTLKLFTNLTVSNSLNLINGYIESSPISTLNISDNAVSNSGSASSFVIGMMRKIGNDAFIFPLGKNGKWAPLGISAPASPTSQYTANYVPASYENLAPIQTPSNEVSTIEYWELNKSTPTDAVQVSLFWQNALLSGITDCAALALANWNGNAWSYSVGTTTGACNGTAAGNITSVSSQAENGIYSFVFYGNVTTQSITVCNGESYTIGNSTYTTSGTYVDVFTNTQNEDSTVITQLTVLEPITSTQSETICAGTSFTIGTNTFSFPGVYPVVLTSVDGCDSLVSLTLYVSEAIDLEVVQTGLTLKTNYLGTGYQWVNCSTNESIPGATNSQFTVTENGSYAVIIYDGFCVDTTACISFANVGLEEKTFSDWIHVYPNPCQGIVNVQWNSQITVQKLRVVDGTGRTIETISNGFQEATALQLHELTSGMYWLHFETDQGIQVVKFVVE